MSPKKRFLITLLIIPGVALAALAGGVQTGFQQTGQFTGDATPPSGGAGASAAGGAGQAPTASQVATATGGGGGSSRGGGVSSGTGTPSQQGNANAVSSILHPDANKSSSTTVVFTGPPVPMDNDEVREIVMDHSINAFHGPCACPYSRNSDGFECGVEAAYYKPGGYRIYCYPEDVRKQLNIFYRKTH